MKESKTFPVIDILKFFFALCIVAVHVWFLYDTKIGYYLYTMLYRLGVPFFFFTSGYFLANKVAGNDAKSKFNSILKKTFVRYILLSIICVLINLIKDNNFTIYTVLQNMYQIIIGNCWGIAWFLGALLYSYLIIYFIKDKKTMKISITIALVLHFFGLLCTTYCFLIKYNDYSQFYKFFIEKFYNNSNFLFEGFLYVGLGYYINAYSEKIKDFSIKKLYMIFFIGLGMLYGEVSYIKPHLFELVNYEYFFSHLLLIPSIFMIGIKSKLNKKIMFDTSILRSLSIYFFYFHMMVLELLLLYRNYSGNKLLNSNVGFYFSILVITLFISLALLIYKRISKEKGVKNLVTFGLYLISIIMVIYCAFTAFNTVIWADESCSLSMLRHNLLDIIKLNINDVHPPLYYLLLKIFYNIFNFIHIHINFVILAKIFSFIPLIILIIFSFVKIRKKYDDLTSSLFCLLIIGMPHLLDYFLEIRMYSWAICFTTIAFVYLTDILDSENINKSIWIKFVIFSILSAYSHLYSCLCVVLMYVYLLLIILLKKNKELIKTYFIYAGITFLLYLPWVIIIIKQFLDVSGGFWIPPVTLNNVKEFFTFVLQPITRDTLLTKLSFYIMVITLVFLFITYFIDKKNSNDSKKYLTLGLILPFIVIGIGILVSLIINPLFLSRYTVPSLGCMCFALSVIIANYYHKKRCGLLIISFFVLISCANVNSFIRNEITLKNNKRSFDNYNLKINNNDIIVTDYPHMQLVLSSFNEKNTVYCYECYNSKMIFDLFTNLKDGLTLEEIVNYEKQHRKIYFFSTNLILENEKKFVKKGLIPKSKSPVLYEDWYSVVVYEF